MIALAVVRGVIEALELIDLIAQHHPALYTGLIDALRQDRVNDFDWDAVLLPPAPDVPVPTPPAAAGIDPETLDVMARTIFGEARNQPWAGLVGVGYVLVNRAKKGGWWGHTIISVAKHPQQFSCWNAHDPNLPRLLKAHPSRDVAFRQCLAAATAVLLGLEPSPVGASCHYHATSIAPVWAQGREPKVTIGDHVFYEGIA